MQRKKSNYVLYDGDCGFCNRSVAFILKHEKNDSISFAPLQSTFTKELFESKNWEEPNLSTFYFIQDGEKKERSAAAFEVVKYLKWPYSWLRIFRFLPLRLTNWGYDQVAKRRQRIAGNFCVMPTPEERERFQLG